MVHLYLNFLNFFNLLNLNYFRRPLLFYFIINGNILSTEKIYYSIIILVSALSVLLSPFFYIRRGKPQSSRPAARMGWWLIIAGNILVALVLLAVWYFWLA